MDINIRKFIMYLIRWQLSTPVMWVIIIYLNINSYFTKVLIANLIGGIIFFWIDMSIFRAHAKS